MRRYFFLVTCMMLMGCNLLTSEQSAAADAAQFWADAYFNCDYHDAEHYATSDSRRWLLFAASNTSKADLELLGGKAEVDETVDFLEVNDTICLVTVTVRNFLATTPLNEAPQLEEEGRFELKVVKRDGRWLVRMEDLPRSGRQSRD